MLRLISPDLTLLDGTLLLLMDIILKKLFLLFRKPETKLKNPLPLLLKLSKENISLILKIN
jgi:hypothetical protein